MHRKISKGLLEVQFEQKSEGGQTMGIGGEGIFPEEETTGAKTQERDRHGVFRGQQRGLCPQSPGLRPWQMRSGSGWAGTDLHSRPQWAVRILF